MHAKQQKENSSNSLVRQFVNSAIVEKNKTMIKRIFIFIVRESNFDQHKTLYIHI